MPLRTMNCAPRGAVNDSDSDYVHRDGGDDDGRGRDRDHDHEKNAYHDHPSYGLAYFQESHHRARPKGHDASCVRSTLPPHRRQESFRRHVRSQARHRHRACLNDLRYHVAVYLGPLIHAPRVLADSATVCIVAAARPDGHFIVSVYTGIPSSNKPFPITRQPLTNMPSSQGRPGPDWLASLLQQRGQGNPVALRACSFCPARSLCKARA